MIPPTFLLASMDGHDDDDPQRSRSMLTWLVPASIALHVAIVILLPGSKHGSLSPRPPSLVVVEMQEPPPPKPKPKPIETIDNNAPAPPRAQPKDARTAAANETRPAATTEAPLDFSGMTFSNDGPGVAIATAPLAPAPPTPTPTLTKPQTPAAASVTPFVPLASLKRAPRAPAGLDAELERNYPPDARRSGISGTAVLKVGLEPDGRVGRVDVVSESYSGFGNACSRTVKSSRWDPPLDRDGRPAATEIKYVCKFEVAN